jgi:hypothetical protein
MDPNSRTTKEEKAAQNRVVRFSQRTGYSAVRQIIQKERIDAPLRNKLWSVALFSQMKILRSSFGKFRVLRFSTQARVKARILSMRDQSRP